MRLLICTSTVDKNHTNLGFFHEWVRALANEAGEAAVIMQFLGNHSLPDNVHLFSCGKEKGFGKLRRTLRFFKFLARELPISDAVFVHMSPLYAILTWPLVVWHGKPMYLWYVHKNVNWQLRLAHIFCDKVFSVSPESFRIRSPKVIFVGHGIDTSRFIPAPEMLATVPCTMIRTAGRISRAKRLELLIDAAVLLKDRAQSEWCIEIIGDPLDEDGALYFEELKNHIAASPMREKIKLRQGLTHEKMPAVYQSTHIFVNLSETGSVDKAVLEAMSTGASVVSANEAFFNILPPDSVVRERTPAAVARALLAVWYESRPRLDLREIVVVGHSFPRLIKTIVNEIKLGATH
ncbi:MAG: glycosyltransferase [Candidatus Sungbacteria bacterium]|nr:glycosyltransferase [Candidatus Sungbacteria bacterium]